MARAGERPIAEPHGGRAKFAEHLPKVLGDRALDQLGWRLKDTVLFVPMVAGVDGTDAYLLRLGFDYYVDWPPTATFVNPETLTFNPESDLYWVPKVEGDPGLAVHPKYSDKNFSGQLICCSFVCEFYLMMHSVQPELVWDSARNTFGSTIRRVQRALRSDYYKGRWSTTQPGSCAA